MILSHFSNNATKEVLVFAIYILRNADLLGNLLPAKVPGLRHDKQKIHLWCFGLQVTATVPGTSDRGHVSPGYLLLSSRELERKYDSPDLPI